VRALASMARTARPTHGHRHLGMSMKQLEHLILLTPLHQEREQVAEVISNAFLS